MKYPLVLVWLALALLPLSAQESSLETLIQLLDSETFKEREEARKNLVDSIHNTRSPALTSLLAAQDSDSPEVSNQARLALREVFSILVLGKGRRAMAATFTYWIDFKNGKTLTYPVILTVGAESFLAKAGIKVGDVISASGAEHFEKQGSVPALMNLLQKTPHGTPLELTILRGLPNRPFEGRQENISISVTPVDSVKTEGREEKEDEFENWLESLGKSVEAKAPEDE